MSKGMATCKVCGRDFALIAEEHYIAKDPQKGGLAATIAGDAVYMYALRMSIYCTAEESACRA